MTVYVDDWRQKARVGRINGVWCHMFADTLEELHTMADRIGMKRSWFQDKPSLPHYDVVESRRAKAVELGAIEVSWRTMGKWIMEGRFRHRGDQLTLDGWLEPK